MKRFVQPCKYCYRLYRLTKLSTYGPGGVFTLQLLLLLLALQVTDSEKRSRADFIIDTGCSLQETEQHVVALIDALKGRTGTAYQKALRRQQQQQQQKL